MFTRTSWLTLVGLLVGIAALGQGIVLPRWSPAYQTVDRMTILSGVESELHSGLRYFQREDVLHYALQLDSSAYPLTELDRADLQYIYRDNNEWLSAGEVSRRPVLKHFYRRPAHLLEVDEPGLVLRIDPLLNLQYGAQQNTAAPYFFNQRGVALRGSIDGRIHFYSNIVESQARFPEQVQRFVAQFQALPGNGFYKPGFSSALFGVDDGIDFLNSQAQLGFQLTEHVGAQFGYGKHFLGNGYRSVLLSDFANNYLHLTLNWRIGKLHLQNIFAEVNSSSARALGGSQLVPKKYLAAHYLSIRLRPNLTLGLFEAVAFSRENNFDLQYLNPIILYRTVEQALGSPDNVMLGFNVSWSLFQRFQLYGQFLLDEFKFDELLLNNEGWWANKYALQLGTKYPNLLGVDHLDLQLEYNMARPYTYTHFAAASNYNHYGLPLAHPLGANFREGLVLLTYRPHPRWQLESRYLRMYYGEDTPEAYYGRSWNESYVDRVSDYGNYTGQGIPTTVTLWGLDVAYQLRHNLFLELHYSRREQQDNSRLSDQYLATGLRMNMGHFRADF